MAKAAFIGLGVMGFPMAGHLAAHGHEVTVYNRTPSKAAMWVERHGGGGAATPREAASGAEFVFACVGDDNDLRQVTTGPEGAFAAMAPGAVFIDHTTASADVARELAAEAQRRGLGFIDAPVSGGQAGAENGVLTVMCGGQPEAYARAEPVIAAFARACRLMGPAGSGQLAKMVNQICIAGLVEALAEGVSFAQRAGLDVEAVIDVISRAPPSRGRWRTATRPWPPANSISASPSTGCGKTCQSASRKRAATAPACRSRRLSTSFTARSRPWAAAAGTHPA